MTEAEHEAADRRGLEEEYKILQGKWDDFDKRALQIRGWFVAGAGAAIGLSSDAAPVWAPIALGGAALNVWMIEAIWKGWQHAYQPRIFELEAYFRGGPRPAPMQMQSAWLAAYEPPYRQNVRWIKVWREMWTRSIAFAYLPFVLVCTGLAVHQSGILAG